MDEINTINPFDKIPSGRKWWQVALGIFCSLGLEVAIIATAINVTYDNNSPELAQVLGTSDEQSHTIEKTSPCTGDYSFCSNTVTIGNTLGTSDVRDNNEISYWSVLVEYLNKTFELGDTDETSYTIGELWRDFVAAVNQKLSDTFGSVAPNLTRLFRTADSVSIQSARINTSDNTLTITYSQNMVAPTFITDAASDTVLLGADGLSGPGTNQTASRSLSTVLGAVHEGSSVRLCTAGYETCSKPAAIVFFKNEDISLDWKKPENPAIKPLIREKKKYFEVSLVYAAKSNPLLIIEKIRILDGYAIARDPNAAYNLELYDSQGAVLSKLPFDIPESIYNALPAPGKKATKPIPPSVKKLAFALMVEYNSNARSIGITDTRNQILSRIYMTNTETVSAVSNYQTILGSDVLNSNQVLAAQTGEADSTKYLDITFIGDDYTVSDLPRFHDDVKRFTTHLFTYEPFASRADKILIHYVDNTADLECEQFRPDSGTIVCNTAKTITAVNNSGAPHDKIALLFNNPVYGGGAGGGTARAYNGQFGPQVFVHELAHELAQLSDEYDWGSPAPGAPIEKNCYLGSPPNPKWNGIVPDSSYFLGCGASNWYRSSSSSIMRSLDAPYFNPISQKYLNEAINVFADVPIKTTQTPTPPIAGYPSPTPTNPPTGGPTPTPQGSGTIAPTPTSVIPSPSNPSITDTNAILKNPSPATFTFNYSGPATEHHIDVSIRADMSWDVYVDFGKSYASTITVPDPTKWNVYTCGKTLYWRVRHGSFTTPTFQSAINPATVTCDPTPTPTQDLSSPTYTNLNATLLHPNPSTFRFNYSGPLGEHHIDVSTRADMSWDVYVDFGRSTTSPVVVGDPTKWTGIYTCNKMLYWRVRQGSFQTPTYLTPIQTSQVICPLSPTNTPTPTPSVVFTPTPTPYQQSTLHRAYITQATGEFTVEYSQVTSVLTYVSDPNQNVILQSSVGFQKTIPHAIDTRPLSSILGNLQIGSTIRLCTSNYLVCSNTVVIGGGVGSASPQFSMINTLGVEDEANPDITSSIENAVSSVQKAVSEILEGAWGLWDNLSIANLKTLVGIKHSEPVSLSPEQSGETTEKLTADLTRDIKKYDSNKHIPIYNYYLENKLINLAKIRQKQLLADLHTNPRLVTELVLPEDLHEKTPKNALKFIEEKKEYTGIYRTAHVEIPSATHGGYTEFYIEMQDNRVFKIHFNEQKPTIKEGSQITINGTIIENEFIPTKPLELQINSLGAQTEKVAEYSKSGQVLGTRNEAPIPRKVYAISFVPIVDGKKLWQNYNWQNPDDLLPLVQSAINESSNGRVNYTISLKEEYPIFNQYIDGFTLTAGSYDTCVKSRFDPTVCHQPWSADYQKILRDYDVCGKVNRGEIDELWLYGGAAFGYHESALTGPNAFFMNGGPIAATPSCNKLLPIMGFSYETGWENAVHSYGHRSESVMTRVYGSWEQNRTYYNWDKFGLVKLQSPDFSYSGCGSIHYAPNSLRNRIFNDTVNDVDSTCDDFYNYPSLTNAKSSITCTVWGCSAGSYYKWWLNHLPSYDGLGPDGKYNNWWKYIANPNKISETPTSTLPSPTPRPSPTPSSLYGNFNATLDYPGSATFSFTYGDIATEHTIDLSTSPNMVLGTYLDFGKGLQSPVTVPNPTKWSEYTCGKTFYWRIRQGPATVLSTIQTSRVAINNLCPPSPSLTPTPTPGTPSVTKTPTPAPTNPTTPYPTTISSYSGLGAILFYPDAAGFGFTYTGPEATHHIDASTIPDMSYNTYVDFGVGLRSPIMAPASSTSWPSFACNTTLYWRVRQGSFLNPTTLSLIQPTKVGCPITPTPTPTGIITPTLTKTPTPTQIISGPTATKTPTPTPPVGGTKTPTPGFTKTPTPTITKSPTPTPSISGPTATKTPTPLATRTPTPTNSPTPASIRTPTPTQPTGPTPTPTPPAGGTPSTYWTNLTGNLKYPGNATFSWTYNGPSGAPHIDVSTSSDLTQNFKPDFVIGAGSPTVLTNPASVWTSYNCNTDVYWRVRQGTLASPIRVSYVKKSTVTCPASPTPTLTKSPTPTITPTPTQQPSSLQQVVLHNARINSGNATLSITYTRLTTSPVYITDATSNTIIQENGYSGISPSTTEFRPLNTFLGPTLQQGKSIKLCTGNYSLCSNTSTIGQVQGVSDTRISLFRREIMTQLDESITGHLRSLSTQ